MTENGFEYVDLGLPSGTMWATCNVGATKLEDQGLLFQFGRVDGYKYGDKNHKFKTNKQNKKDTGNEYLPLTTSGKIYKENEILDLADDAAHVNMGGAWKMPTKDQLEELYGNTKHDTTTINGVKGMMFTSKINKHQMFIPFIQGCLYDENWANWKRSLVYMWSSQVSCFNLYNAYRLNCYSSGYAYVGNYNRSAAFSVRGVFNNNEHKNTVEHTNNVEYADNINMLI